ncbi:hypothetical protein [Planomicrobium okeanokoites]|uniref:hypothetical protein n=1 Tax=Planomicrobium okeanokoites TaxID=244 RepID=UPI000A075666|nr:hypothetical protein [Planomicrobium okeanokoites]
MEKKMADYVLAVKVGQKEFGYVLIEELAGPKVEVIVIDHECEWVRTIGEASCLKGAGTILSAALSKGFELQGVIHQVAQ